MYNDPPSYVKSLKKHERRSTANSIICCLVMRPLFASQNVQRKRYAVLQGYLPAQLYNLSSCYGNKEQLQSLTWTLNHAGIMPVADIVINHRCADVQNADGIWNSYRYSKHALFFRRKSKSRSTMCCDVTQHSPCASTQSCCWVMTEGAMLITSSLLTAAIGARSTLHSVMSYTLLTSNNNNKHHCISYICNNKVNLHGMPGTMCTTMGGG